MSWQNWPRWDPKKPVAPFNENGDLLTYPGGYHPAGSIVEWREVEPFEAKLALSHLGRQGRSSVLSYWVDVDTEANYPMFLADLEELLKLSVVEEGFTGRHLWTVRKRGANYGIALWGLNGKAT